MLDVNELRKKSIINVAADLGFPLRRQSSNVYEHPDHDSFKVFANTNTFKWFSRQGVQGDVLDFVQLVKECSFKEALAYLDTGEFKPVTIQEVSKEPFRYFLEPYENDRFNLARDYLRSIRQLSDETIDYFKNQGLMAEAQKKTGDYLEPVIVFKCFDEQGALQGASLQGITENRDLYTKGRLKQIMSHSDGSLGMSVTIGRPERLVFLEAPIDLMSYYQLNRDKLENVRLVAMEGLKDGTVARYAMALIAEQQGKLDSLDISSGKFKKQLETVVKTTDFFEKYPDFITLAVDNDDAGRSFVEKLADKGLPIRPDFPPSIPGKEKSDWNDLIIYENSLAEVSKKEPEVKTTLIDKEKLTFLLFNHTDSKVYNAYAILSDYQEEMMMVTKLYNAHKGNMDKMVSDALSRNLLDTTSDIVRTYNFSVNQNAIDNSKQLDL